jgi:hypothetical protein
MRFSSRLVLFVVTAGLSLLVNTLVFDSSYAQFTCFNTQSCWRNQVGFPRIRARAPNATLPAPTTISWDMDSGSFQFNWSWTGGVWPQPNFEDASNHAAYEWTIGNLSWDQRDSCAQARATGNTVACIGLQDWCTWLRREGLVGLSNVMARTKLAIDSTGQACGGNLPEGWQCIVENRIRVNGFIHWRDNMCGSGTVTVGSPINPIPGDTNDPRFNNTCDNIQLPTFDRWAPAKQVTVHEYGHTLFFYDIPGANCLPQQTVMEPFGHCGLQVQCPSIFHTSNDYFGVRYLYGP